MNSSCSPSSYRPFRNESEDLIDSVSLKFIASPQQPQQIAATESIALATFRQGLGRLLFHR